MRGWGLFFFLLFLLLIFAAAGWVFFTQYRARRAGLPPPTWRSYIPFIKHDEPTGSNYPSPRASGPIDWVRDQLARLRSGRTARGAYERESGGATGGGGGGGAAGYGRLGRGRDGVGLEEDAWDTRVGDDEYAAVGAGGAGGMGGYYEEQELGLAPTPGVHSAGLHSEPYEGASGGAASDYLSAGGSGYGGQQGRGGGGGFDARGHSRDRSDPFGDHNEEGGGGSLRSVSPRPDTSHSASGYGHTRGQASLGSNLDDGAGNTSPISTRKSAFREGI